MSTGMLCIYDYLSFSYDKVAPHATKVVPTKRNIVSVVGKFYDLLGLAMPSYRRVLGSLESVGSMQLHPCS